MYYSDEEGYYNRYAKYFPSVNYGSIRRIDLVIAQRSVASEWIAKKIGAAILVWTAGLRIKHAAITKSIVTLSKQWLYPATYNSCKHLCSIPGARYTCFAVRLE